MLKRNWEEQSIDRNATDKRTVLVIDDDDDDEGDGYEGDDNDDEGYDDVGNDECNSTLFEALTSRYWQSSTLKTH